MIEFIKDFFLVGSKYVGDDFVQEFIKHFLKGSIIVTSTVIVLVAIAGLLRWKRDAKWFSDQTENFDARKKNWIGPSSDSLFEQVRDRLEFKVSDELGRRTRDYVLLLRHYEEEFRVLKFRNSPQLAAAELFTEKAQLFLTTRAQQYYHWAIFFVACSVFMVFVGLSVLIYTDTGKFIGSITGKNEIGISIVIIYFIRAIAIGGLFGGAAYLLVSLARAFFHEGTVLFNRRHATRLGRLYMIIKYGERDDVGDFIAHMRPAIRAMVKEPPHSAEVSPTAASDAAAPTEAPKASGGGEPNGATVATNPPIAATAPKIETLQPLIEWASGRLSVTPQDLEAAFGWNIEPRTAFKDIKPEMMSVSLYVKMAEAFGRLTDKVLEQKGERK